MSLDAYLRRFGGRRRVTLVGPMLAQPLAENPAEPLVWVDGGADHRIGKTGFAVGDGDSSRGTLDLRLPVDKDFSDLAYVLRRLPGCFTEVVLLGFLGGRLDHALFNLGEVHRFLAAAKTPTQARFDGAIRANSKGGWTFERHGVFSLAVLAPATVTLAGACQFPLTAPTELAVLGSLGLSNRGFGEISVCADGPVFVFQPDDSSAPPG